MAFTHLFNSKSTITQSGLPLTLDSVCFDIYINNVRTSNVDSECISDNYITKPQLPKLRRGIGC